MISRRDKLLNRPGQQQFYEQHRQKVYTAKPAIDSAPPTKYMHVIAKPKKVQIESERLKRIEVENIRLLQNLGDIMRSKSKRLQNLWVEPRPTFLHREKMFEPRPRSSVPKLMTIYTPFNSQPVQSQCSPVNKSARALRCPTCSGRPERTEVKIPEERIPWEPQPKSLNYKIRKYLNIRDNRKPRDNKLADNHVSVR